MNGLPSKFQTAGEGGEPRLIHRPLQHCVCSHARPKTEAGNWFLFLFKIQMSDVPKLNK